MILLLVLYIILFTSITFYRFHYGLFLLFLLLPTYLIRFPIGPLPTTLLENMIWILAIIWMIKYKSPITYHLSRITKQHPTLFLSSAIFLIGATIAIFSSLHLKQAAGEWKAFYIEPFMVFLMIITTLKQSSTQTQTDTNITNYKLLITNYLLYALILCGLITSLLAIYQHFTGWMVPYAFWQNRNTFRVTGWYGYPNAVALFVTPLVPLALYLVKQSWTHVKEKGDKDQRTGRIIKKLILICSLFLIPCSMLAIYYAKSTGGLIGLAGGIGVLLVIYKKTRWPAIIIGVVGVIGLLSIPQLTNIRQEILAQDRSGQIRVAMWGEALALLSNKPILGAGLRSYVDRIAPYHTQVNGENIEIFHLQHNLFLSLWVNIGLIGLFGFIWILVSISHIQYSIYKKHKKLPTLNYFLISSILIMLVMGLVDTPYMKNDLAVLFWGIIGLLVISPHEHTKKDMQPISTSLI